MNLILMSLMAKQIIFILPLLDYWKAMSHSYQQKPGSPSLVVLQVQSF